MKYCQLDRITSLQPGVRLTALRTLRADEEYLKDHFPRFPVMPGVMMLEALHQAAVWLIRTGDEFQSPVVLLREVRGVKFGDFLSPGETLEIVAETLKTDGNQTTVKGTATKQGRTTVSARMVLERCETDFAQYIGTDDALGARIKKQFHQLFGDVPLSS